ncbi:MAG: heavy metal sensor histidine kinase [Acidobacteria bacterium]|nr:heavy metal sensor histidine kinase [Acidobacteriota bacterium]
MRTLLEKLRFVRALRFRLTLTNAIFLTGLLLALGFFFRGVLSNILDRQIRDILDEEWGAVKGYLVIHRREPTWMYDRTDQEESFIVERLRRVFLLADSSGKVLFTSPIYEDLGVNSADEIRRVLGSKQPFWQVRRSSEGEPFQIRGGTFVDDNDQVYFVAIGRSLAVNERTLREFNNNFFLALPILILSGSLLGWFVAGRALRPVNDLALAAGRISGSNLSLRIPLRRSGDELDHLIGTFNHMVERLEQSFEMTRQFSTDVSHELRTPLTAIRGQLEVALFTASSKEQYREAMINALEEVDRLSQTVRALLLLSQAESGQLALQKSLIELGPVVEDIVDQFQIPAEEARLQLRAETGGPAWIEADRLQIERLVANLLSNAVKYTPAGGSVTARVRTGEGAVVLGIEDTGIGISQEYLPHIFDRFYRVPGSSKEKQGLGLGLSFVAWIVKAHGGNIDVDSRPGEGTRFTVTLPSATEAPAPVIEQTTPAAQA